MSRRIVAARPKPPAAALSPEDWERMAAAVGRYLIEFEDGLSVSMLERYGVPSPPPGTSWEAPIQALISRGYLDSTPDAQGRWKALGELRRSTVWEYLARAEERPCEGAESAEHPEGLAGTPFDDLTAAAHALAARLAADVQDPEATSRALGEVLRMTFPGGANDALRVRFIINVLDALLDLYLAPMHATYSRAWSEHRPGVDLRAHILDRGGWGSHE